MCILPQIISGIRLCVSVCKTPFETQQRNSLKLMDHREEEVKHEKHEIGILH